MNDIQNQLLLQFHERIESWRPDRARSGTAATFRKDRAELNKIHTAFRRGRYREVIEKTDMLDTIVRGRVPRALLDYASSCVRARGDTVTK